MKFKSTKDFTTSDWGKMAATGILAGIVSGFIGGNIAFQIIMGTCYLAGLAALVVWIYKKIKKKP